jgi:hypothetical protein
MGVNDQERLSCEPGPLAGPEADMREVCALVLVGGRREELFAGTPLALFDVLGRSVLMRTVDRLRTAGVRRVAVVSESEPLPPRPPGGAFTVAPAKRFWEEAWEQFRRLSRQAESVFVIRLGAWAEVDYAAMVKQHARVGTAMLQAYARNGEALDVFVVSSGGRSEAAALLRGELRDERIEAPKHRSNRYVNRLATPADLRLLALDALAGEAALAPVGTELRPGVWVGKGARIHREARVVAPAFIGASCRVHREAVVTRGSTLEHHSEVDCGSVIENSTLLPYSRIGAGLDVEYSVAGLQHLHSLKLAATVEVDDPRFIGSTIARLPARARNVLGGFLNLAPDAIWELLFGTSAEPQAELKLNAPSAINDPALAPVESQAEPYGEMATTRRYGSD